MDIRVLLPDDLSALLELYKHMHVTDDSLPDKKDEAALRFYESAGFDPEGKRVL